MKRSIVLAGALLSLTVAGGALTGAAGEPPVRLPPARVTVERVAVADLKAVFATVESVHQVPARSRLGGTLTDLAVKEGDKVAAGQVLARVRDAKLPLQMAALDARLKSSEAQLRQARQELDRARQLRQTGAVSQQRFDETVTAVDVADSQLAALRAERELVAEQMREGDVLAPADGRVLTVPVIDGTVMMPGEPVATIAAESYILRLRLPERHARFLKVGDPVSVGERGLRLADLPGISPRMGAIRTVYPELTGGQVVADAVVPDLGDFFVGERVRVTISTGSRQTILLPAAFVFRRGGLDYVRREPGGDTVVQTGPATSDGRLEVLSGLQDGDLVVMP
ncbi:MAG: efflux RND transporter periplasmic adaptor subunit [Rhodospirillaceae bacterium]